MANKKFKLSRTGNKENSGMPQYSISYKPEKRQSKTDIRFEILSKLKGDNDAVIEINTSLLVKTGNDFNFQPDNLLNEIRSLNLEHSYRKVKKSETQFVLSIRAGSKSVEHHEIYIFVPDDTWNIDIINKIAPTFGVRFYMMKKSDEGSNILNKITNMSEPEKADYFEYIVFDAPDLNRMGITSNRHDFEDIKKCLETD